MIGLSRRKISESACHANLRQPVCSIKQLRSERRFLVWFCYNEFLLFFGVLMV